MHHRLGLLLLVSWLVGVWPTAAQEATDEPFVRDEIVAWYTDMLFPTAVRFTLATDLRFRDVTALRLTIETAGREAETIALDIDEASAASDAFSQFAYVWPLPPANPPRPFEPITLTWRVTAADGTVYGVRDEVLFADRRAEWQQATATGFPLRLIAPADGPNLNRVLRDLEPLLDLLADDLDSSYTIMLSSDPALFDCPRDDDGDPVPLVARNAAEFDCDPAQLAALYASIDLRFVEIPSDTAARAVEVLTRTFIDDAFSEPWDAATVPPWFRAGFARFYVPAAKGDLLLPALTAARNRSLLALPQMNAGPPVNPQDAALWEAQSYGMVLYLASRAGVDRLLEFGRALGDSADFATAYEQVFNEPVSALIPAWQRWLFTDAAETAYGYIPFGPNTPTPTLTPTPSLTPTETPVPTRTPTATRTRPPTLTPTRTSTPTITPRPPGSLLIVTPVLTPTSTATPEPVETLVPITPQLQIGLIAVLLTLLAALVYLYIRLDRRSP